jgi:hypothetical protein
MAGRSGQHDAQQGVVTSSIAGAFAQTDKHKQTASSKQLYCKLDLPSDRFHKKISLDNSPACCRAELVYSVDVRALADPSGR